MGNTALKILRRGELDDPQPVAVQIRQIGTRSKLRSIVAHAYASVAPLGHEETVYLRSPGFPESARSGPTY